MRNKGRKAEEKFIKTINSGAFYQKGDAISDTHCLEIKSTVKKSFRLTTDILEKLWEQAFSQNKYPLLGIVIEHESDRWLLKVDITREKI